MERIEIIERVNDFFNEVDNRNWEIVKSIFANNVLLDYTSLSGGEPVQLKSEIIIDSWKALLPGFDSTQYLIGNHVVDHQGSKAEVFCYVIASHFIDNVPDGNTWTVYGTYDIELCYEYNNWHITKLKLNKKFNSGNNNLPAIAQERVNQVNYIKSNN